MNRKRNTLTLKLKTSLPTFATFSSLTCSSKTMFKEYFILLCSLSASLSFIIVLQDVPVTKTKIIFSFSKEIKLHFAGEPPSSQMEICSKLHKKSKQKERLEDQGFNFFSLVARSI